MTKTFLTGSLLQTKKIAMAAIVALAVFNSGCKKDEDDSTTPTPTPTTYASVRYFHASPDAPTGVDVLVDNAKVNTTAALNYSNQTAYIQTATGSRSIKINSAATSTTLLTSSQTFAENKYYTVFVADLAASLELVNVEDNLTTPAAGKAHLRFVHMAPDAPAVDIAITGGSGAPLFSNKAFKSASAFTPLAASNYNLEVRYAGTTTVITTIPSSPLAAGKIYTILARGLVGGTGTQALTLQLVPNN